MLPSSFLVLKSHPPPFQSVLSARGTRGPRPTSALYYHSTLITSYWGESKYRTLNHRLNKIHDLRLYITALGKP